MAPVDFRFHHPNATVLFEKVLSKPESSKALSLEATLVDSLLLIFVACSDGDIIFFKLHVVSGVCEEAKLKFRSVEGSKARPISCIGLKLFEKSRLLVLWTLDDRSNVAYAIEFGDKREVYKSIATSSMFAAEVTTAIRAELAAYWESPNSEVANISPPSVDAMINVWVLCRIGFIPELLHSSSCASSAANRNALFNDMAAAIQQALDQNYEIGLRSEEDGEDISSLLQVAMSMEAGNLEDRFVAGRGSYVGLTSLRGLPCLIKKAHKI